MIRKTISKIKTSWIYYSGLLGKSNYTGKVFCVGYNKTGTTTLGKSLEVLGYRNLSFNTIIWRNLYKSNKIDSVIKIASKFDSFDDLPWLKEDMIPILDSKFPESKFIYLTRDEDSWKNSYNNWRVKQFGTPPNSDKGWKAYKKHEKFVLNYFQNRSSDDFLILQINDPMGFQKLATFLNKKAPYTSFPHFNKT